MNKYSNFPHFQFTFLSSIKVRLFLSTLDVVTTPIQRISDSESISLDLCNITLLSSVPSEFPCVSTRWMRCRQVQVVSAPKITLPIQSNANPHLKLPHKFVGLKMIHHSDMQRQTLSQFIYNHHHHHSSTYAIQRNVCYRAEQSRSFQTAAATVIWLCNESNPIWQYNQLHRSY